MESEHAGSDYSGGADRAINRETWTGRNLVFVIGCPRSGTTWMQRLLSSHPKMRTGQESHLFHFYIGPQLRFWRKVLDPDATGRGGVGIGCYLSEAEFMAALRGYFAALFTPIAQSIGPGEMFVEKTPSHALYVREILEFLPEARFIHVVRDPRDVVASLLAAGKSWGSGWAPRSARRAAALWSKHIKAVHEARPHIPSGRLLEVRYEALHDDPETVLASIAEFLELEWPRAEIRLAIQDNGVDRLVQGQATPIPVGGVFANSTGAVKEPEGFSGAAKPGRWKKDLTSWQRFIVWRYTAAARALLSPDLPTA